MDSQTIQIVVVYLRSWLKSCQSISRLPTHGKINSIIVEPLLFRVALLGSASSGKSTLCGVLTQGGLDSGNGSSRLNFLRYLHEIRSGKTSSITVDCFGFSAEGQVWFKTLLQVKSIILDFELQRERLERHSGAIGKNYYTN
jgi:GTPase